MVQLTIDGKDITLTEEQMEVLRKEYYTCENPFKRKFSIRYFYITASGRVSSYIDHDDTTNKELYETCNHFTTKAFAEQVALRQLLYRKLLRFAYDNKCIDTAEWNDENDHWCIHYNRATHNSEASNWNAFQFLCDVYFSSKKAAERAIKEVVEPFMKEHPDFIW